jgi:hypothetical protein
MTAITTHPPMRATATRRLWLTVGWLLIGYVALTFAGVGFEHTPMLGDKPSSTSAALVHTSMTKNFAGGYLEFLASLVFLVGALLLARLLRGDGVAGEWLSSCMAAAAVIAVAITVTAGLAAGAAAIYDGHHGASLQTVTTVNDIRNFAFILSGGLYGMFTLAVATAVWVTRRLPRWVSYTGFATGVVYVVAIPAARTGIINLATLLGFVWLIAVGVAALRQARRPDDPVAMREMAVSV